MHFCIDFAWLKGLFWSLLFTSFSQQNFIYFSLGFWAHFWNHSTPHLTSSWEPPGSLKMQWFSKVFLMPFSSHFGSLRGHHFSVIFRPFFGGILGMHFEGLLDGPGARFRRPCRWKRRFASCHPGLFQGGFLTWKWPSKTSQKCLQN